MVGKSAYFSGYSEPAVFSNHFLRLRPAERLDGRYLAHWLRAQFQRGVFAAGCRKWVNQATFGKDSLVALQLPLPSLEEQQRIAAILDKADELQTKRRAAIAHLDSLLQAAFADRFGAEMSSGVAVELNEVIHPDRPICYGILKPGPDLPGGRPYVRVVDMVDGGIAHDHVRRTSASIDHQYRRSRLSTGDLVISIRGHVGRLALVPPELDGANITQDSARLSVNGADPAFVVEHLRHPLTQEWLRRNTKGAAVRGINIGDLRRVPVFLPAAEAQTEYAELWRKVDRVKASASAAMRCSAELVASLQARAFRGEV
jgi:type I restriction enzyme S subunit